MFSNGSVALSSTIKGEGFLIALPPYLINEAWCGSTKESESLTMSSSFLCLNTIKQA